jgi:hypothetical protein
MLLDGWRALHRGSRADRGIAMGGRRSRRLRHHPSLAIPRTAWRGWRIFSLALLAHSSKRGSSSTSALTSYVSLNTLLREFLSGLWSPGRWLARIFGPGSVCTWDQQADAMGVGSRSPPPKSCRMTAMSAARLGLTGTSTVAGEIDQAPCRWRRNRTGSKKRKVAPALTSRGDVCLPARHEA